MNLKKLPLVLFVVWGMFFIALSFGCQNQDYTDPICDPPLEEEQGDG